MKFRAKTTDTNKYEDEKNKQFIRNAKPKNAIAFDYTKKKTVAIFKMMKMARGFELRSKRQDNWTNTHTHETVTILWAIMFSVSCLLLLLLRFQYRMNDRTKKKASLTASRARIQRQRTKKCSFYYHISKNQITYTNIHFCSIYIKVYIVYLSPRLQNSRLIQTIYI